MVTATPVLPLEGKLPHPRVPAERRGSVLALEPGQANNFMPGPRAAHHRLASHQRSMQNSVQ